MRLDDEVFSHQNNPVNVDSKEVGDKNNKNNVDDKDNKEGTENDDSRHRSWNSTDRESQSDNE